MISNVEKDELCQISLTGIRSLVLLGLLIEAPRSLEDIKQIFISLKIMGDDNSYDIIRIDINTLRKIGCEISRADKRTDNKFVLLDHPFKIDITMDEADVIKQAFNKVKEKSDISVLTMYDNLFGKIAPFIKDNEVKEFILKISPLRKYSSVILEELKNACENKNLVKLVYKAPASSKEMEKEIFADRIALQNDKLYLYGVDKDSDQPVYLNIKRILKLLSSHKTDEYKTAEPVTVKFFLKDFGITGLLDNEKIIGGNASEGFVICGQYHNSFFAIQRILSFGSKCIIFEPEEFKERVIEIIKKMRDVYNV